MGPGMNIFGYNRNGIEMAGDTLNTTLCWVVHTINMTLRWLRICAKLYLMYINDFLLMHVTNLYLDA